ncbi:hypothetical protein AB6A40_007299 [Gnathostoma spinigerum]|uniref:Endonuclease/exonuclease/phosphatase domain-containing protein n=1 Tax=Gnathostoma spinigerum TaxID=75299 RepID=A0ABD6EM23_9BILA
MTFNIWLSGANVENGLQKIATNILQVDPDIVTLQEVTSTAVFDNLLDLLGSSWKGVTKNLSYPDTAIITKHKFMNASTAMTTWSIGARIFVSTLNTVVSVWNLHLNYKYC